MDLDLTFAIAVTGGYSFSFFYLRKLKDVIKIYKLLSDFKTFGKPENFDVTNKKLNYLSAIHYVYIIFVLLGISAAPLLDYKRCERENIQKDTHEVCGLIGSVWLSNQELGGIYKYLVYIFQVYSTYVIYMTADLITFSIVETAEHLVVRFRHVRNKFLEALNEMDHNARRNKFNKAVDYHVAVIGIAKLVNSCFNMCMFVHILLTGAILGCAGYTLLKRYSLGGIFLFVGWFCSVIMGSISGQRLMDEVLNTSYSYLTVLSQTT